MATKKQDRNEIKNKIAKIKDVFVREIGPVNIEFYDAGLKNPSDRSYILEKRLVVSKNNTEKTITVTFESLEAEENAELLHLLHKKDQ